MRLSGDTIIGRSEGCENMELCGYELRFELWETEGIFKNKNFGRLSQDIPQNIQILESRRRGGELCKAKKRSMGEENRDQKLKLR